MECPLPGHPRKTITQRAAPLPPQRPDRERERSSPNPAITLWPRLRVAMDCGQQGLPIRGTFRVLRPGQTAAPPVRKGDPVTHGAPRQQKCVRPRHAGYGRPYGTRRAGNIPDASSPGTPPPGRPARAR